MIDFESEIERILDAQNDGGSHTERDTGTFHPSQLAKCPRQCAKSKLGLEEHTKETLGRFKIGTLVHEWLEDSLGERFAGVEFEKPLNETYRAEIEDEGSVEFGVTGHCDVYDSHENAVYDFKTRNGWYKFDPPNDRHLDQLTLYMDMVGAEKAQVVYLNKADLEVRTYPENGFFELDEQRLFKLLDRAATIKMELDRTESLPSSVDELPFGLCDCWLCGLEVEG